MCKAAKLQTQNSTQLQDAQAAAVAKEARDARHQRVHQKLQEGSS